MQTDEHAREPAGRGVAQLAHDDRPCQAPVIQEYDVEDELVLYDPSRDFAHVLNPTAAAVWWLCDGKRAPEDISIQLADMYGLETGDVREDVREVITGLRRVGLLDSP